MQIKNVFFVLGFFIASLAFCMFLPVGISLLYGEFDCAKNLASIALGGLFCGLFFSFLFRPRAEKQLQLTVREGVAVVGLSWTLATVLSALPYYFITDVSFFSGIFEAASGLSTTGASIYSDIEALPYGILFWRSLTQWLGGLGIIVFSLALLPFIGAGGMQLYRAEASGVTKSKIAPRMVDTARTLWIIYISLTLFLWLCLYVEGMSSFDAINHAFTTMATGGFSTKNSSLALMSPSIQWIIIVFMFLAGINFSLHYALLFKGPKAYTENEECFSYALIIAIGVIVISAYLYFSDSHFRDLAGQEVEYTAEGAIRTAALQVVSLITTTGFASADYLTWPLIAQGVLLLYMFTGGCAGSTAGGIKIMRVLLSVRMLKHELRKLAHPHGVERIKINGQVVSADVMQGVATFIILFTIACLLGTLALLGANYDLMTSFSAVLTSISNVGPGFADIGPAYNFGFMNDYALGVLSVLMIFGRLELFTILLLFTSKFWRI